MPWCEEYVPGNGWEWWKNQYGEDYSLSKEGRPCQPINAYTSFAFCVWAIFLMIAWYCLPTKLNALSNTAARMYVFGTVFVMGPLSWLGHACVSWGAAADQMGLWMEFFLMAGVFTYRFLVFCKYNTHPFPEDVRTAFTSCSRTFTIILGVQFLLSLIMCILLATIDSFKDSDAYAVYAIIAVYALGGEFLLQCMAGQRIVPYCRYAPLVMAIVIVIAAFIAWTVDMTGHCNSNPQVQGHGAWHVLVSWATFSWYLYLGKEDWVVGAATDVELEGGRPHSVAAFS